VSLDSRTTEQSAHPSLRFRLPLDPARLLRARQRIRDYLDQHAVSSETIDVVVLAIEEAMTNAVRHSGAAGDLEVRLGFEGRDLCAQVEDHGAGFDVDSFDRDHPPDPLSTGGRGLFLMAQLMDDLDLICDGGLEVRMLKRAALPATAQVSSLESGIVDGQLLESTRYRERRLRLVVEELGEGYAALDWEYRFTYANKVAYELYSRRHDEVLGHTVWELFPHIEKTQVGRAIHDSLELGSSAIVEFASEVLGRWIECRVYPTGSGVSLYLRDIEERKRKEVERDEFLAALIDSEERFRSLFGNMTEGVALHEIEYRDDVAVDYRILEVNPAFERQTGVEAKAVRGQLASEAYGSGEAPYLAEYAGVVRSGEPHMFETYFEPMGRHFRITAVALGLTRFATVFEDVTARRQRDLERDELLEALSAKDEKYRTLFESMDEGFCIIEVMFDERGDAYDYRFLETNPAFVEQTGLVDAVGRTVLELVPGQEAHWFETYGRIARTGVAERFEDAAAALGRYYDVFAFRFGDPAAHKVAVFFTDVAERRRVEQALEGSERRYRELVQNANSAIVRWSRDGSITFLNEYAQALFGWSADEAVGKRVDILVPPQDSNGADLTGLAQDILDHPERYESNANENVCRDGRRLWMTWTNKAIMDDAGKVAEVLAVGSDISELKQAEEALRASEERYGTIVKLADEELLANPDGTYSYAPKDAGGSVAGGGGGTLQGIKRAAIDAASASRGHPVWTLLGAWACELAFLVPLGAVSTTRNVLGMPGSLLALIAVIAGTIAGPLVGVAAALGGGIIFYVTVADLGDKSSLPATVISTAIWVAAALVSSLLAEGLLEETRRRKAAAVALAKAETMRQAEASERQRPAAR
jgi:PAS domain S-box-containing protein